MNSILSLKSVSKIFYTNVLTPVQALRSISMDVKKGEFVCIIGANGSGKSTLLRTIAGVHRDITGTIFLNDKDITKWPEQRRARIITLIDQIPGARMAPDLTIEQNLALVQMRERPALLRISIRREEHNQFHKLLESLGLGLENRLKSTLREVSGGQAQALTVAAVIGLTPPKILLLDEHCAGLDARMSHLVMKTTANLCREHHITTIMVTHNFEDAAYYGDRLIMMRDGELVWDIRGEDKRELTPRDIFDLFMKYHTIGEHNISSSMMDNTIRSEEETRHAEA